MSDISRAASILIVGIFVLLPLSLASAAPGWMKEIQQAPLPGDIHEDVSAVALIVAYETKISSNGSAITDVRRVVKILKGGGSTYSGFSELMTPNRKIYGVKGWLIDKNGKEHSLERSNIVEIADDVVAGNYNESRSLVAGFPEVSAGDLIGYEFTIKEDKGSEGLYKKFDFPKGLPILQADISIELPKNWQLQYYHQNLENLSYAIDADGVHTWHLGRQRYFPEEPFMPSGASIDGYVFVNCHLSEDSEKEQFSSWQRVAKWADDMYIPQYEGDGDMRRLALGLTAEASTASDKINIIAAYVRDDIRYVAVELGEGRFQPRGATQTCTIKYGDCKDKATAMVALLRAIGISSRPVLINTRQSIDTMITTPYQFNHVIVAIPATELTSTEVCAGAIQNGWLYFDPTDQTSQLGYLPSNLYGNYCLHVADQTTALARLPEMLPEFYQRAYQVEATLHEDNSIVAAIRITDKGKRAAMLAFAIRNSGVDELIEEWRQTLSNSIQDPRLRNFESGSDADSTWFQFTFTGKEYLVASGDLQLLKADFIHYDRKSDLKKRVDRHFPISFGHPEIITTDIIWTLPEGWAVSEGLDSTSVDCRIARLRCQCRETNDAFGIHERLTYLGGQMDPTEYDEAREFDRKRCAIYSRKLFITKP